MKPLCVIQSPLETRSGYGDMARDICRHIIELDKYDVKLISTPWGATPMNALNPTADEELIKRILPQPIQLSRKPDLYIQITVPNEFQAIGTYNIGITAGIETTAIALPWIQGCNRMNTVWAISEHAKAVIENTVIKETAPDGRVMAEHKVTVPVEVLHNCINTNIFKKIESEAVSDTIKDLMLNVPEKFCFLFVGHWLKGNINEDRKNVSLLVKIFCETFKNLPSATRPALILKTSGAMFSILDREEILAKIRNVRNSCGPTAPNVYLIHGELTDTEMNGLYNHPKIKVHVSFTHGEGFGRPLLEAVMSQKPVIAPGWSGQLDFLTADGAILLPGELKEILPGSVWENVIIPQSHWFFIDNDKAASALMWVYKKYDQFILPAKRLAKEDAIKFSYDKIKQRTDELLIKYVPKTATEIALKLPTLKKLVPST